MVTMSPFELRQLIVSGEEFALVDVREQGAFAGSHLLFASCAPACARRSMASPGGWS